MYYSRFDTNSEAPAFILTADAFRIDENVTALSAAGFRCCGYALTDRSAAALAEQIYIDLILVDLRGCDEDEAVTLVTQAMARRAEDRAELIVRLTPDLLDMVFDITAEPGVTLLCDPSVAELAGALALLSGRKSAGRVRERESEAERLRRLNEEVARIAETLARLVQPQDPAQSGHAAENRSGYQSRTAQADSSIAIAPGQIRNLIRARRLRDQFFNGELFADPAWDILLDLFAAELERVRVSVSSLCIAAAVPPTTALRWISSLIGAGLLEREPDPADRRRAHVKLTGRAGIALRNYFAALKQAGLTDMI